MRQVVPNDPIQGRDLGIALLNAGQPGRALDLLEAYLASGPKADDTEAIRELVKRAQGEVARWN
jgi:regulator of sirC expression with transglutaminase-like and TPR domain